MSAIEIKLRVHFEAHPAEPLTAAQLAQRLDIPEKSLQRTLLELHAEGFLKRKRSLRCMRPYVWIRADQAWPGTVSVQPSAAAH